MASIDIVKQNHTTIEKIYVASVVLAMGLLFYANAENQWTPDGIKIDLGLGKTFYLPCAIALCCSFYLRKGRDKLDSTIYWLMVLAIISSILQPPLNPNVLSWLIIRFLFGILCFINLRYVNASIIIKYFTIASPFIVFPHYIVTNPFAWGSMRYGGLYGDANYLAMSLNFLNCLCYLYFKNGSNKIIKFGAITSFLGSIPLIMLGMSRGGLIGLGIIVFLMLRDIWRNSKPLFFVILLAMSISTAPFAARMANTIENISTRFSSKSETDVRSSELRFEGIQSGLRVLSNQPLFIPFGIGTGNTEDTMKEYEKYGYTTYVIIHSTPFAVLYEMGIFAFFVFCYSQLWLCRFLFKNKRYLLLAVFLATSLGVLTLQAIAFMPFWIIFFTISKQENIENLQLSK